VLNGTITVQEGGRWLGNLGMVAECPAIFVRLLQCLFLQGMLFCVSCSLPFTKACTLWELVFLSMCARFGSPLNVNRTVPGSAPNTADGWAVVYPGGKTDSCALLHVDLECSRH
jgi:hypothetical protein